MFRQRLAELGYVVVVADSLFLSYKGAIMRAALKYALPAIVEGRELLKAGALLSYDVNAREQYRRVAALLDKVLRGAKPADLPIEQPTKFELIINLRTTKALGLTICNRCWCARTR